MYANNIHYILSPSGGKLHYIVMTINIKTDYIYTNY